MQKRDYLKKVINLELWSLLTIYRKFVIGLFKEPIIGSLKSKMAEIRHPEGRHDVIFSAEGGLIWVTFRRLVQNDMSTAVMWSKSKPDVKFQYGGRWANSMACHLRATYHIAGCNNSIRHIENRFSPYFVFFVFVFTTVYALTSGGFRIVSDTLV